MSDLNLKSNSPPPPASLKILNRRKIFFIKKDLNQKIINKFLISSTKYKKEKEFCLDIFRLIYVLILENGLLVVQRI